MIILLFWKFFTPAVADGFPIGFEWQQVISILQDSSRHSDRYQQCSSLVGLYSFSNFQVLQVMYYFLMTVLRVPIGITVNFMFHSFFNSLAMSTSFFSLSFNFTLWSAKFTIQQVLPPFFFCWLSLGLVIWLRLGNMIVSQNSTSLCVSFSGTDFGLCIYHLFVWSNLNFLPSSRWITFPTQSCLI